MANQLEPRRERRGMLANPFERLFPEIEEFFGPGFLQTAWANRGALAADVRETEQAYVVSLDAPGIDRKALDIDLKGNMLTVRGERHDEQEGTRGRMRFTERQYGSFERSFTLPSDIDVAKVEARYDNGVLEITIPKSAAAKAQKVTLKD